MTDAPAVAETVRQSIIFMNIVSRELREGRQLVLDYKTRSSETVTDQYQGIHTTKETKKGLAINRKNVCITSSTNTLLAETIEITGFKTDSALINYAVRLYYAVLSVLIDGGRVLIRYPDDTYRDLIIIANWRKTEVQA